MNRSTSQTIFLLATLLSICVLSSRFVNAQTECVEPFIRHNRNCYMVENDRVSWSAAETNCRAKGGKLTEPQTTDDWRGLVSLLRLSECPVEPNIYWTGRRITDARELANTLENAFFGDEIGSNFQNQFYKEPRRQQELQQIIRHPKLTNEVPGLNLSRIFEDFGERQVFPLQTSVLVAVSCRSEYFLAPYLSRRELGFVCEASNSETSCPAPYISSGTLCYYRSEKSEYWLDAVRECTKLSDGTLVRIESNSQWRDIKTAVMDSRCSSGDRYWTDGVYTGPVVDAPGSWMWASKHSQLTFTAWAVNEPTVKDALMSRAAIVMDCEQECNSKSQNMKSDNFLTIL